jgi:hypothetical protein
VLKQNSAHKSQRSQLRGRSPAKQCSYMMMIDLVTSDWPFVCGWKAELICSVVSQSRNSSCQSALVKTGSLLLTIHVGTPCSRMTVSKEALAADTVEYGCPSVMQRADFEKRSTTVKITDLPPTLGNPLTKSMVTSIQTVFDTVSSCIRPAGWRCSDTKLICQRGQGVGGRTKPIDRF